MTINSYFYDSVAGDRVYSGADFAKAFGIVLDDGILPKDDTGTLGFDIGGTNYTTIYAGKAVVQGHFVEVSDTEILTVPTGSYSGQIVLRLDISGERRASLVVKTDQTPTTDANALWEMPLYNCTVTNGVITSVTNIRVQGGAWSKTAANVITWQADPNGIFANMGLLNGTGKPIKLFLTSAQPAFSANEIRAWIQIDKF
jgi:hypothetical protein